MTFFRRHGGGGESGVLVGDDGCGGFRARPLGTGPVSVYGVTFFRRYDGGGESGVLVGAGGCGGSRACPLGSGSGSGMHG